MKIIYALVMLIGVSVVPGCSKTPETYATGCSAPLKDWGTEKDGVGHLLTVMPVSLDAKGRLQWGKHTISDGQLTEYMREVSALVPQPQVILEVAPSTSCGRVKAVRRIMDDAAICKGPYGLCSEGRDWKKWPIMGGP